MSGCRPDGLCILHSLDKGKDPEAFNAALLARWNEADSEFHDFRGVCFPGPFDPHDVFGSREFKKPIDFSRASFTGEADFSWATFSEAGLFYNSRFTEAIFSRASFVGKAIFSGARFSMAYFTHASCKEAIFSGARFAGEADFSDAKFTEWAGFSETNFTEAIFSGARFAGEANFSDAKFTEWAGFFKVRFTGEASFISTTFTGTGAFFKQATIAGRVIFRKVNSSNKEGPTPVFEGGFINLEFQDRGVLRFQDMSLAQVEFAGTDLRRPEFHHVIWHPYRGRQALYDEILLGQKELSLGKKILILTGLVEAPEKAPPSADNYAEVERLYRNLEINYEGENDYKSSGDFHYGELEMHRQASKWRWFPLYWYNLYKLSSGYGERPLRALLSLGGLFLVFAGLFFWLEPNVSGGQTLKGFGSSLLYVFQQGTLQKPPLPQPLSPSGSILASLIPVLIPGQVALFFLALRNRLGRRR